MTSGSVHVPTEELREYVRNLKRGGATNDQIASCLNMCDDTLRKYYKNELDNSVIDLTAEMTGILVQKAREGELSAAIFWLKTKGGYRSADAEAANSATLEAARLAAASARKSELDTLTQQLRMTNEDSDDE